MSNDLIKAIKERIDLADLAREAGVQLKPEGDELVGLCPFHEERGPSFHIYESPDGQRFKCFGCGASGDVLDFYQWWQNVDQTTAMKDLAERAGVEFDPRPGRPVRQAPPAMPEPVPLADGELERQEAALQRHPEVLRFLQEERRLSPEVIRRARLGYDAALQRIVIPLLDKNGRVLRTRLYDWQHKRPGRKVVWGPGKERPRLYPVWALDEAELLLAAGEMDCLAAWSLGIPAVTGTGGERSWGRAHSAALAGKRVVICYDVDPEGRDGARLVAEQLVKMAAEVRILTLPLEWKDKGDPKDLTDWILAGGTADQLRELMAAAPVVPKPAGMEEAPQSEPVLDRLPDAPVGEDALFPERWLVNDKGVFEVTSKDGETKFRQIVSTPVVITSRIRNLDKDVESLEIAFHRNGRWRRIRVEREIVADKGRIVRLASRGLPVTSNTAGRLVQYLSDYETTNMAVIPEQEVVSVSGWRREPEGEGRLFVAGKQLLGTDMALEFQPENEGDGHLVDALRTQGDREIWRDLVRKLMPFPRVMFCLYASCAVPLLMPCEASNFIIDLAGDTSRGKTTTLELAASCWGLPAGHEGGLVKSWNQTKVFAERYAALFNDLPVFFDDSQTSDPRSVASVLYMVANGVGRGRGAAWGGLQPVTYWRTICFSTGEQPLTSNTEFGGARARVITLWGSPFGEEPQGDLVRQVKAVTGRHHGFLGYEVIRKLIQLQEKGEWDRLRDLYLARVSKLAEKYPGNVTDRMSRYVALVWVAADLVHSILDFEEKADETIQAVMREIAGDLEEGDYATRALDAVRGWAQANMTQFHGKEDNFRPPMKYLGVWRDDVLDDPKFVAFYTHDLKKFLADQGFTYESVVRQWKDRGWIRCQGGRSTYMVRIKDHTARMVMIPLHVWKGDVTGE